MAAAADEVVRFEVVVEPAAGMDDPRAAALLRQAREMGLASVRGLHTEVVYELTGPGGPDGLSATRVEEVARSLLADPVAERWTIVAAEAGNHEALGDGGAWLTICRRPGVMDPVTLSLEEALRASGEWGAVTAVRRALRVRVEGGLSALDRRLLRDRVLSNPVIEAVTEGRALPRRRPFAATGGAREVVPLAAEGVAALARVNEARGLSLSGVELDAIAAHFAPQGRDPSVAELETIAQTWSEHCKHKTMAGPVRYDGPDPRDPFGPPIQRRYRNLLGETVFAATRELDRRDLCLSVFSDNAGVIALDRARGVCMKVETHNHPSALEPYGGAGTGVGGVIRDVLGTGLGARPIAGTSTFGFGPVDLDAGVLPEGALHPRRIVRGVVHGVRDYGNRMGIPTVSGGVFFHPGYALNPVVFCGTIGVLPRWAIEKAARPGDAICLLGGRTGRDGIHGATFSSRELDAKSERVSGGAVQIGNPIEEKRVLEALLRMRDARLLHAVTDCGAGGLSSAVGEMAEGLGASVWLERVPLKYEGLLPDEIWISEAQERMVLAAPRAALPALERIAAEEGTRAVEIGRFEKTGRLRVLWRGEEQIDLDLAFLHEGLPKVEREARGPLAAHPGSVPEPEASARVGPTRTPTRTRTPERRSTSTSRSTSTRSGGTAEPTPPAAFAPGCEGGYATDVLRILGDASTGSREAIIRQYDHEVQGQSVLKPYAGVRGDGPQDAAVLLAGLDLDPEGGRLGIATACGMNPRYGELDPYRMAWAAVDEAVRNVVAVGADPGRTAVLDNFTWGDARGAEGLGALVWACEGLRDAALAYRTPFISGKDSLNNERADGHGGRVGVPPTLLVSALAICPDVARTVSSDLKDPGSWLGLCGETAPELGGSALFFSRGLSGGEAPAPTGERARLRYAALFKAMQQGWIRSAHDLAEGGLAVAIAEMAIGGRLGARIDLGPLLSTGLSPVEALFSESLGRLLIEVAAVHRAAVEAALGAHGLCWLGTVDPEGAVVATAGGREVLRLGVESAATAFAEALPTAWV